MDSENICLSVFLCICVGEGIEVRRGLSVPWRTCGRRYGRQNQVDHTRWSTRTRVCEAKPSRLYPLVFVDEGMWDKIKPIYSLALADEGMWDKTRLIIPAGLRGRGYVRQNQVDYTRWSSWMRVCETKPGWLYPLALVDEGMGGKTKSIYPLTFVQRGVDRDSVRINPGATRSAGRSKRFCQKKPRRHRDIRAQLRNLFR